MSNYKEERPWGNFEVLYDGEDCKVKRITVYPGGKLSLQSHSERQEVWTIVSGVLGVVVGAAMEILNTKWLLFDDHIKIPQGWIHRAFNDTDKDAVFIEVQTGTYFGEDDIVRYEDDYDRVK